MVKKPPSVPVVNPLLKEKSDALFNCASVSVEPNCSLFPGKKFCTVRSELGV